MSFLSRSSLASADCFAVKYKNTHTDTCTHTCAHTTHPLTHNQATPPTHFKVRVIEAVDDIPSEHEELPSLQQEAVKEAQCEQQLLVLVLTVTAGEGRLVHQLVETFHVGLQALQNASRQELTAESGWLSECDCLVQYH